VLEKIYLLPHGLQIIPGVDKPYNEKFKSLHDSMTQIGINFKESKPDIVFLVTPHGYSLDKSYVIYGHNNFQGFHYELEDESVVDGKVFKTLKWKGDNRIAIELVDKLNKSGINTELLIHGSSDYPLTLCWGPVVPLTYVADENMKIIILSLPRSRYERLTEISKDLEKIGEVLLEYMASELGDKKVNLVISADLAHAHDEHGIYGFHPSAAEYDRLVSKWVKTPSDEGLTELLELNTKALSCGMAGLIMLNSILDDSWENIYKSYSCPSYFGMIVSEWSEI
jgi:aromatic ring-opening dioxygenase LigB subunit